MVIYGMCIEQYSDHSSFCLFIFLSLPSLSFFLEEKAVLNETHSVIHTMLWHCTTILVEFG